MSGFLLDTNVLSEFARVGEANPAVKNWLTRTDDSDLFVSVLTLGEIRRGIEKLGAGKRRTGLELWLEHRLLPSLKNRILPVTYAIADRWAILTEQLGRKGITLSTIDGLIAATAREQGLSVVTRNVKHFSQTGLEVINPWD